MTNSSVPDELPPRGPSLQRPRRFAAVGAGGRIPMFIDPIARDYPHASVLTALCDTSHVRMRYHQQRLARDYQYQEVPLYGAEQFERMIRETQPDVVIVCTPDSTHHTYIVHALELGCDVVTEKPLTTDEGKCAEIFSAVQRTGRSLQVAFNYRWGDGATKVYELLRSKAIGDVVSVHFEYMLNTSHGADYFRRWHSRKENSGGLLVHKATHHFDLVNWWIDAIPDEVYAHGRLAFYGQQNALTRGDQALTKYPRYTGYECADDPFAFKLDEAPLKHLYRDAEEESGYLRDLNVFRPGITIEDTMSVLVRYRTSVTMTYALNAFSPMEGFRVTFTGDRGRLEYEEDHGSHLITGASDVALAAAQASAGGHRARLRLWPHFKPPVLVDIPSRGAHGGGDPRLQAKIFSPGQEPDPFGRHAGHEQGAASILVGIAANRAIASKRPVHISELFELRPECQRLSELI